MARTRHRLQNIRSTLPLLRAGRLLAERLLDQTCGVCIFDVLRSHIDVVLAYIDVFCGYNTRGIGRDDLAVPRDSMQRRQE